MHGACICALFQTAHRTLPAQHGACHPKYGGGASCNGQKRIFYYKTIRQIKHIRARMCTASMSRPHPQKCLHIAILRGMVMRYIGASCGHALYRGLLWSCAISGPLVVMRDIGASCGHARYRGLLEHFQGTLTAAGKTHVDVARRLLAGAVQCPSCVRDSRDAEGWPQGGLRKGA
jgi:hypothetical protein